MTSGIQWRPARVVLVELKTAALAVENLVGALLHDVLLQRPECLRRRRGAVHGASQHFRALAVFDMVEPVRQLKYLLAVGALYPDLVYYIVQVAVLLLWNERRLALAALGAALGEPLLDALLVEDLFAVATLDCPVSDA